jgi:hypothetical protein
LRDEIGFDGDFDLAGDGAVHADNSFEIGAILSKTAGGTNHPCGR